MILKSIKLHNIRSYNFQVIKFQEGSSLLLGDIGSGKTTILLAIEFALFGLIKGDVTGETLLRHGKNDGSVELEFDINNKNVKIMRRLKRKKDSVMQDSGYIMIDNIKTELTPIELKSKILEIFGYPEDLLNKNTSLIYRYTVYTPQEEMKNILFESREDRLDILRKIFNIDKYKRVRENSLIYAKELRTTKKILESKLVDIDKLRSLLSDKNTLLKDKNDFLKNINESIVSTHILLKDKDSEILKIQETINKVNVLRKELAVLEANLKNSVENNLRMEKDLNMINYRIKEYENKLNDLGIIDQEEDALRESLKDSEDKLTKINSAKETIKEKLDSKQNDLKNMIIEDSVSMKLKYDALKKNLESLDKKIKEHDEKISFLSKLSIDINTLIINNENSKKILNNLKDLSVCPTCLQNVDFNHKIRITDRENINIFSNEKKIKELEEKKKMFEHEILNLKNDIDRLHNSEIELKSLEVKMDAVAQLKTRKEQLQKEIEDLLKKKEKLDAIDVNKLMEIISRNRKVLSNIGVRKHLQESLDIKRKEREQLKAKLEEQTILTQKIKQEFESKNSIIKEYSSIEQDFNLKNKERTTITDKLKELEINKSLIEQDIKLIENEIKNLEEEININTQLREKINFISELNHWLTDYFVNLTSIIEKNIMRTIHREFNELFKEWFSIIVQDQELDVSIDEDFAPTIRQNNYDTSINNLSGGEKTAVALAYRLALNKVINDFINNIKTKDIIMLDEPTDGFSSEQLDRMRDVLEALKVKQLIIVSHEAKMESYAEHIIRIQKNNHVSGTF